MSSLSGSLVVFAIAFGLVVLVLLLHRRILPHYGIWIGTEAEGRKRAAKKQSDAAAKRHVGKRPTKKPTRH